jgi:microcompartment protein CcmL/EutN
MLKSANVRLFAQTKAGGGLVAVFVTGDVGSVKAAVEAGTAAGVKLGQVKSAHVIPRPIDEIGGMLRENRKSGREPAEMPDEAEKASSEPGTPSDAGSANIEPEFSFDADGINAEPEALCEAGDENGDPGFPPDLEKMKVTEMRSLLRKMIGKTLTPEEIKYANRETLLKAIHEANKIKQEE